VITHNFTDLYVLCIVNTKRTYLVGRKENSNILIISRTEHDGKYILLAASYDFDFSGAGELCEYQN